MTSLGRKFPQSIRRDSEMLVERIGPRRIGLANLREQMIRANGPIDAAEARRLDAVYHALLREAA